MHVLEVEEVDPPSEATPYPIVAITLNLRHCIISLHHLRYSTYLTSPSVAISSSKKLFDYKKPTVQDLRVIKRARKRALEEYSLLMEHARQQGLRQSFHLETRRSFASNPRQGPTLHIRKNPRGRSRLSQVCTHTILVQDMVLVVVAVCSGSVPSESARYRFISRRLHSSAL